MQRTLSVCLCALIAALLLVLAGCGGGDDDEPEHGGTRPPVNCQIDRRACI